MKDEWFEGKKGAYLEKYDITWEAIPYLVVMFVFPFSLLILFPVWAIVAFFPQNMNINIIACAWLIFSITDFIDAGFTRDENHKLIPNKHLADRIDAGLADPSLKEEKELIKLIAWRNAGWGAALVLLSGVFISISYNFHEWNFYLGLFSSALFMGFMLIAITKFKFEKNGEK